MNRLFAELVNASTPKFNPYVLNGLACLYVPYAQEWLDGIFKSAAKSFPKGLTYDGMERCTPHEEFYEATKTRSNKRIFDLADSDLYLIKLKFSFEDETGKKEAIPDRFLYLPYVNEAGIFRISGSMYHITGVLSDRVISPGANNIFVRLIRDRLIFRHTGHSVMIDNRRETFNVVWSGIYRKNQKDRSYQTTTKAMSCVAHYLFAHYGFSETFKRYAGFVPKVGTYKPNQKFTPNTIVCKSSYFGTNSKPYTHIQSFYKPSDLYIEIPKKHWNSSTAALVSGFFYIVDHFPERFTETRLDDTFLWSVLLGHIIFSGTLSEARLYERIIDHFDSLDDYLDLIIKNKLKEIGWELENFYDLISKIMVEFPDLLLGGQIDVNSMFNKNIEILYYMLFDITSKIFKVIYYLRKPKTKKPLTINIIKEAFNKNMTPRTIFRVTKNKMIVESVSYCGDHKFPKLTSKITEQEAGSYRYKKKPKRIQLTENNHIHSSMIVCGNVLFLSKSNPMPNTRINPYIDIDLKTGTMKPKPEHLPILEKLQDMLTRTSSLTLEDLNITESEIEDISSEAEEDMNDEEPDEEVENFDTDVEVETE